MIKSTDWISIFDKLPDEQQKVIVYTKGGKILTSIFIKFGGYTRSRFHFYDLSSEELAPTEMVSHWMPQPEPPIK